MSEPTGLVGQLGALYKRLLDDLLTSLRDPVSRTAALNQIGLRSGTANPRDDTEARQKLAQLEAQAASAGPGSQELAQTLSSLLQAYNAVEAVVTDIVAENPGVALHTVFAGLLELTAVAKVRQQAPVLYVWAETLRFVDDGELQFERMAEFIEDAGTYLAGLQDPASGEQTAANYSLLLGAAGLVVPFLPREDGLQRRVLFGWDPDPAATHPNAERVLALAVTMELEGTMADRPETGRAQLSAFVVPEEHGGPGLFLSLGAGGSYRLPVGEHLELELALDVGGLMELFLGKDSFIRFGGGTAVADARLGAELRRKDEPTATWLLGALDQAHLEVDRFSVKGELGTQSSGALLRIENGALVVPREAAGTFLGRFLPSGGLRLEADLGIGFDSQRGVYLEGGAGLETTLPINRTVLGITVQHLTFALEASTAPPAGLELRLAGSFSLDLAGVLKASVDRIGAAFLLSFPESGGNLGNADLAGRFLPPRGLGIVVNAGVLKGGGFLLFDPERGEYGGVLELTLKLTLGLKEQGFAIKAFGLLTERPDGSFSFIVVLSVEFDPPIMFPPVPGFSIGGVGGLLGVNHGIDLEALRGGLRDGALDNLLFPEDPVANAPKILTTLRAVFPPAQGQTVVGLMLALGFGGRVVELTFGVIIALPDPVRLAIVGRLVIAAPDPELPAVLLQVDFVGAIDFQAGTFSFDASLRKSRITVFPLTGDLAVRVDAAGFLISAGGFHPRYAPGGAAPALPRIRRIALDISSGPTTKVRVEGYLAVTSNSFQFGARAEVAIWAGPFSLHGQLHFDALVQKENGRWRFSVEIGARLELRLGGASLLSLTVDLLFEGPGPWHAKGTASFSILFFEVSVGFEATWGEIAGAPVAPSFDLVGEIRQAVTQESAWSGELPAIGAAVVTLRNPERAGVAVHPLGTLTLRQQVAPLGVRLDRVGAGRVSGPATVALGTPSVAGMSAAATRPVSELFAADQFFDLSEDQKLSRPSFEPYQAGVSFGADSLGHGPESPTRADYETILVGVEQPRRLGAFLLVYLDQFADHGAVAREMGHLAPRWADPDQRVAVADEELAVAGTDRLDPGGVVATAGAFTAGVQALAAVVAARPELAERLQVVGAHEVMA